MLYFTKEEFDIMVKELLFDEVISCNMLCGIADKTVKRRVINLCKEIKELQNKGYEEDIMQEIYMTLFHDTIRSFLLKPDKEGYNDDPEGFQKWLFTVARNKTFDFARRIKRQEGLNDSIEGIEIPTDPPVYPVDKEEHREILNKSLDIVMSADVRVYKTLTWLAIFVFMLELDATKIQSTDIVVKMFEDKTLNEMYEMLLRASKRLKWLEFTSEHKAKISADLQREFKDGVSYGETKYCDFFMKSQGVLNGKKSVSDWMNRFGEMLKKKYKDNTDALKKTNKKDPGDSEKRSNNNGSFDS